MPKKNRKIYNNCISPLELLSCVEVGITTKFSDYMKWIWIIQYERGEFSPHTSLRRFHLKLIDDRRSSSKAYKND